MVRLFLADGFEETEALATLDILRRAGLTVETVGVGGREVTGAHGVTVLSDRTEGEALSAPAEMIVLPGGMPGAANLRASAAVQKAVAEALAGESFIGAICAAPGVVLSELGALSGKRYTCYPGFQTAEGSYTGQSCVRDGKLITANGPGAVFEFALALCEALLPAESVRGIRREFLRT